MSGPPAAALAWRAIVAALDFLLTRLSLRSRAITALRISGMALSKNSMMVARGHSASGLDQSTLPEQAFANSGKMVATARVPWLRIEGGHSDGLLDVELFCSGLPSSHADPSKQDRGNDPSPLHLAEPSDRRTGRDGAVHVDDPARARDSGSGSVPLPLVFDGGQRDLSDRVTYPAHCAHPGRSTGGAEDVGGALFPPPLNGGGCSIGW